MVSALTAPCDGPGLAPLSTTLRTPELYGNEGQVPHTKRRIGPQAIKVTTSFAKAKESPAPNTSSHSSGPPGLLSQGMSEGRSVP